ncbi:MAG: hypothetical protein AAF943_02330 [Pseudomonadota bacterium]
MSSFSLRLPYLIYLSIGSLLLGVLVAPAFRDIPEPSAPAMPMMAMQESMVHPTRDVPAAGAPALTMTVSKDPMSGWNILLGPENFTFAPTEAGGAPTPNTGHAHLYVDELKVARIYGPHFHIPDLPPGEHTITVALSSNDHAYYTVAGNRIEARAVVLQENMEMADK